MKQHTSQEVTSCEVEGVSCEASVSDPTTEVVSKNRNVFYYTTLTKVPFLKFYLLDLHFHLDSLLYNILFCKYSNSAPPPVETYIWLVSFLFCIKDEVSPPPIIIVLPSCLFKKSINNNFFLFSKSRISN